MWREKKGDLPSSQTGEWTLFIVAFVILLVFVGIVYVLLKGSSEEDLCKLSVLGRATSPISETQQAVPLKCVVKKVCFSDGRGKCDDPLRGEKNVLEVKIPQVKEGNSAGIDAAARIIEEESAKKMYECWKIMGEGRLDLFNGMKTSFGINPVSTTCVICSRLVVDKNVPDYVLERVDVNEYLRTYPVAPGSDLTYLQAFTGSKDVLGYAKFNPDVFKVKGDALDTRALQEYNSKVSGAAELEKEQKRIQDASIGVNVANTEPNRELAFVFMQIKSKKAKDVVKNIALAGGVVVGNTFMTPVVRPLAKYFMRFALTPWGAVITLGSAAAAGGYGAYNARQGQLTAASYCGEFTSKEQERNGCSMVQGLNYNKNDINALCASIQGRLYDN